MGFYFIWMNKQSNEFTFLPSSFDNMIYHQLDESLQWEQSSNSLYASPSCARMSTANLNDYSYTKENHCKSKSRKKEKVNERTQIFPLVIESKKCAIFPFNNFKNQQKISP